MVKTTKNGSMALPQAEIIYLIITPTKWLNTNLLFLNTINPFNRIQMIRVRTFSLITKIDLDLLWLINSNLYLASGLWYYGYWCSDFFLRTRSREDKKTGFLVALVSLVKSEYSGNLVIPL